MTIRTIGVQRLVLPLEPPFVAAWDPLPRRAFEATLVLVETDEGLTGVGSGDTMDGFERYEHLFLGEDALALERHAHVLESISFHAGRYWPLEAALWDLAGKAVGKPVAELLGGAAVRLHAYASTGELRRPEERAEGALALRAEGFRAVKLRIAPARLDEGIATVAAVRDAVGDSVELIVDLNQAWRMPGDVTPPLPYETVRRAAEELREHRILWLEEPLHGEDVAGLGRLRAETGVPIAAGEMARTPALLERYIDEEAVDVLQPDAVLAVGITRARELAERARGRGLAFSPHTWTNGVGLLANLHLAAGVGGGPFLEFPCDPPAWTPARRDFMLAEPIKVDGDGCLSLPERPGLGVELAEDVLERFAA